MKQLIQNFKSGNLYVDEVPLPALNDKMVLVENKFSLISVGTEKGTVSTAQASLIGKAKQRPDLVRQVLKNIQKEGIFATLKKVQTKLDSLKALGYSTSGNVLSSTDSKNYFKPGDRVACAGQDYASHAEVVAVPQNLVVKIPDNVSYAEAAFTTLGAIALQGVRQANPTLGDNVCVIGLGLLGQITSQILKANGCNVFGIDLSSDMVELAKMTGIHKAMSRTDNNLMPAINYFTNGYGFDSVIITAAAKSNDPIEFSAEILRKKGRVVVVGSVGLNVPRDPHFYRKELDLRLSCSYGPGRYDNEYEENGIDYPIGYVRWTEQRNMEAFLKLVSNGAINIKPLITHIFNIEDAVKAYDMIMGKTNEKYIGILLKYNEDSKKFVTAIKNEKIQPQKNINAGFIGAGSFAQSYLLPYVKKFGGSLDTVVTNNGINAKNVANKFNFANSSTNSNDILSNEKINTIFIATRHDSHAKYFIEALNSEKNVFVEKPLAMNQDELEKIINTYKNISENKSKKLPVFLVGFNRRFSSLAIRAKEEFNGISEPLMINMRINAGYIPSEHWIQDEIKGGGRIIGEMCHFIDLMQYFTDSRPVKVYAECLSSKNEKIKNEDNISVNIKFENGSVGTLIYLANGDSSMPKEKIEIFGGKKIFVIEDFHEGILYINNGIEKIKLSGKGHEQEVKIFLKSITEGLASPINFESLCYTTLTTFKIKDSIKTGLPQEIL